MKPDDHGPARLGTNSCGRWRMQTDDHRKRPFTTELGRWMIAGGGRQPAVSKTVGGLANPSSQRRRYKSPGPMMLPRPLADAMTFASVVSSRHLSRRASATYSAS